MTGGQIAEDDEFVLLEYVVRNRSSVGVDIVGEGQSAMEDAPVLFDAVSQIPVELKVPVTRMDLMLIEDHFNPPSFEVCHQLLYEQKAKLHLQDLSCKSEREKKERMTFWTALASELASLAPKAKFNAEDSLLVQILTEIKSMLIYLYPDSKLLREQLLSSLDVPFIVEQLKNGHLNILNVTENLCQVFKANCAPKRDMVVDQILSFGRSGEWIKMLQLSLELMELMKLDLVNYRMTVNRQTVLAGFLTKERVHFDSLFDRGVLTLSTTRNWLRTSLANSKARDAQSCVLEGFLDLLISNSSAGIPETFTIDARRLQEARTMLQDISIVVSSMLIFEQFLGKKPQKSAVTEMKARVVHLLASRSAKISDITGQILLVVGRLQGTAMSEKRRSVLAGLVDCILDPTHPVFTIVQSRLRELIRSYISGKGFDGEYLGKCRLESVQVDLESILPILKMMWIVQWKVHRDRFTTLYAEIAVEKF